MKIVDVYSSIARFESPTKGTYLITTVYLNNKSNASRVIGHTYMIRMLAVGIQQMIHCHHVVDNIALAVVLVNHTIKRFANKPDLF